MNPNESAPAQKVDAVASVPQDAGVQVTTQTTKQASAKPVRAGGINLIRDTGQAVRVRELHAKVYKVCSVILVICLLIGGSGYGYWFYQSSRISRLEERIAEEEDTLESLVDVYNLVSVYQQRLEGIRDAGFEKAIVPLLAVRDLDDLATKTSSEMVSISVQPRLLEATMEDDELSDVDYLMELLEFKEVTSVWNSIQIEAISRVGTDLNTVIFSGTLTEDYGNQK